MVTAPDRYTANKCTIRPNLFLTHTSSPNPVCMPHPTWRIFIEMDCIIIKEWLWLNKQNIMSFAEIIFLSVLIDGWCVHFISLAHGAIERELLIFLKLKHSNIFMVYFGCEYLSGINITEDLISFPVTKNMSYSLTNSISNTYHSSESIFFEKLCALWTASDNGLRVTSEGYFQLWNPKSMEENMYYY